MVLLLTGFEPWGDWERNPSGEVARSLGGARVAGAEVVSAVLPVAYGKDTEVALPLIEAHRPAAVVSLGLRGNAGVMYVERLAVNLKGRENGDLPIAEGGPAAYFSSLPVWKMVARLREAGVPARMSYSAGTFLCNHIMYSVLHYLSERGSGVPAGFIHVPPLPEQVAASGGSGASMSPDLVRRGVVAGLEAVVAFLREHEGGKNV